MRRAAMVVMVLASAAHADERRAPALDAVALEAARSAAADYVVTAESVRAGMAAHLGSGIWPHVLVARGTDAEIEQQLAAALAELRATVAIDEIGRATAEGPAGRIGVLVAVPPPPLPISVERDGDKSRITLAWPWTEPANAFAVTPTAARRLEPQRTPEGLVVAIDCARGGAIEVSAGAKVVASVVDACGDAAAVARSSVDVGPPATTRVELEQRVFALVNRERVAHHLAPLAWDPDGHAFARGHAAEMAAHHYIGHQSSTGATYRARVAAAPFPVAATHENVGRATGPGEVHAAFLHSPGHRANLLADDVDRGAIGVVYDADDPRTFYITEFFRSVR